MTSVRRANAAQAGRLSPSLRAACALLSQPLRCARRLKLMFYHWGEFYLLAGSAAAVLIGLIFVVVTLMQDKPRSQMMYGSRLYMGPTVLQVSFVLVLSAAALTPGISAQQYGAGGGGGGAVGPRSRGAIDRRHQRAQGRRTAALDRQMVLRGHPHFPVRRAGRGRLGLLERGGVGGAWSCGGQHRHPAARHSE